MIASTSWSAWCRSSPPWTQTQVVADTAVDIDTAALQHSNHCTLQSTRHQDQEVITTDNSQMDPGFARERAHDPARDLARERVPGIAKGMAPDLAMVRSPDLARDLARERFHDLAMDRAPPVPVASSLVAPAPAPWQPSPAYSVHYQTGEVTPTTTARPGPSREPSYRYGYSTPDKVRVLISCCLCRYK